MGGRFTLELYDEPQLIAELRRLRTKYTAGSSSVINPRVGGSHGDIAQALALAIFEHDRWGIARGSNWRPRKRKRPHLDHPGSFYYPLGFSHGSTGSAISVSAPFEMNADRSALVDPSTSSWNEWLLSTAAEFALDLRRREIPIRTRPLCPLK